MLAASAVSAVSLPLLVSPVWRTTPSPTGPCLHLRLPYKTSTTSQGIFDVVFVASFAGSGLSIKQLSGKNHSDWNEAARRLQWKAAKLAPGQTGVLEVILQSSEGQAPSLAGPIAVSYKALGQNPSSLRAELADSVPFTCMQRLMAEYRITATEIKG
eukprot:GILI01022615.1.p2 GENE.GILI01022615.1~~GILI01022615.1.p2  ORF type:complete len:183 (+),score=61.92 GILI01022615.1:81-551(+)